MQWVSDQRCEVGRRSERPEVRSEKGHAVLETAFGLSLGHGLEQGLSWVAQQASLVWGPAQGESTSHTHLHVQLVAGCGLREIQVHHLQGARVKHNTTQRQHGKGGLRVLEGGADRHSISERGGTCPNRTQM